MRGFVGRNCCELFDGDLRVRESCGGEIGGLESGKGLAVELRLQLLKNIGELFMSRSIPS